MESLKCATLASGSLNDPSSIISFSSLLFFLNNFKKNFLLLTNIKPADIAAKKPIIA